MKYNLPLNIIIILFVLVIANINLSALNNLSNNADFEKIDVNTGLSQNSVHSIYQDEVGFMWFATADGLNRFDGYEIIVYRNKIGDSLSISNNFINSIFHGDKNGFWVATDNGLNYYNLKTGKFNRYLVDLGIRFTDGAVSKDGKIILTGHSPSGSRYYIFDFATKQFNILYNIEYPLNNYFRLKKDRKGSIWLIGQSQLLKYIEIDNSVSTYLPNSPDSKTIVGIDVLKSGDIVYSTTDNLFSISTKSELINKIPLSNKIVGSNYVYTDENDNIWFCSDSKSGIQIMDVKANKIRLYDLNSLEKSHNLNFRITDVFIDKTGIFWIATDGKGIIKLINNQTKFKILSNDVNSSNSLSNNFPKGLTTDSNNNLWITTINGGLNKFNFDDNLWVRYCNNKKGKFHIDSDDGLVVFTDSKGRVWHGGSNTIDTINIKSGKFIKAFDESGTHIIYEDKQHYIWTGSLNYILNRHNLSNGQTDNLSDLVSNYYDFRGTNIYAFVQESDNIFWIGTDLGLYKLDIKQKLIKPYISTLQNKRQLSNNFVTSLLIDNKSRLWICTRDGLNIYDRDKDIFRILNHSDGLVNSFIYGIIQTNDSTYWLSTNNGLSKLTDKSFGIIEFKNYGIADGLPSNEFNTNSYHKSKDGKLFFGGLGGVVYFHPDSIKDSKDHSNLVITKIKLFDIDYISKYNYWATKELLLNHYENTFSFEFSALSYKQSMNIQYAYKLEGADTNWVISDTRRFARYANMKPGRYTFMIKSTNSDNIWSDEYTSLKIIISPPFWQNSFFKASIVIISIVLIILLFRLRTSQIRKRTIHLQSQIKIHTDEILEQNLLLEVRSKEIMSINENLEKRVNERTYELSVANDKLQKLLIDMTQGKTDSLKSIIKAQEDERSRFAKDLHDGAGQFLAFLKFNLGNLLTKIGNQDFDPKPLINEQIKLVDEIVKELRQFAYALMPPVLERIGLNSAIEELIEMYKSTSNIRIDYYIQETLKPMPKYIKIHIYRIVQEIFSNAIKHSGCNKIHFQLLIYPNNILIVVEDNGTGFDVNNENNSMGLTNIKSRISLINGKIDIDSQLNHGTTITLEIPN